MFVLIGGSIRQGSRKVIVDARVSNSHLWERLEEGAVEYVECYCTGVYPGGRPPASGGIGCVQSIGLISHTLNLN